MTRGKKAGSRRSRRTFSAEFKLEAVRLIQERRAAGASLEQVGRELDVRPDMLRRWARQVKGRPGVEARELFPGQGQVPSAAAEVRRLQRENATLRQERDFTATRPNQLWVADLTYVATWRGFVYVTPPAGPSRNARFRRGWHRDHVLMAVSGWDEHHGSVISLHCGAARERGLRCLTPPEPIEW